MKKVLRTKNNNKIKSTLSISKYPYLLTTYNKNYNTPKNIRSNKSYHNHSHYKMTINENNAYSLYNPDEEYVTKLNFFNIGAKNDKMNNNKITLYNLNTVPVFPSILKKDTDNVESFKEKKRILNELKLKQTLFDKVNNAENSKQTYVNRYENTFKENQLEKERKEIERKIFKLKEMIKSLSNELSSTIQEIDNLKLDVDIMQNFRSYNLFNSNQIKNSTNEIKDENYKRRKSITIKENESIVDKEKEKEKENKFKIEMMLLSNSEKVFKIKQEMKTKLKELENKKALLLDKINICENELKKFKETYHNIKEELLVHYHRLLSEGKDTRKEGLSWIILAIWNLKSNVLLSYLPKFLDQNIILFLFEYSSLLKKIKETEKKIRELALKLKDQKEYIQNNSNNLNNFNKEDNYKNYICRNNKEEKINNELENKNNEDEDEEEDNEEEEEEENEDNNEELDNKTKKEEKENDEIIKEDANENNVSNTKSIIINNKSKINKKNNKSKINEIDEKKEKEINDDKNNKKIKNLKEERKNDINLQTQFGETFKTSLYNTNSDKRENNELFFEKQKFKKEDDFGEIKEKKKIKERNNIIKNISSNFFKSLFKKEDLYKKDRDNENKEKKIKLNDFKNIYNNNKNSLLFDYKTFELFNEHKNMEKYCLKLKEKAELLMKKELDRVSKSFYLYDYGGKYNVDQRVVISALVGEDSVRGELIKQKKQEKEYFKTLRELRNGKISQKI